jgi:AcrR family transcriptional regulator
MPARPRKRRTQEQRSTETRTRLLDATITTLYDLGYAGTTTTEIAARAGVSRGAQLHHFPTKAELVTTAVEHLFAQREREFRAAFLRLPKDAHAGIAALDLLWPMVSGPTFYAWLELLVAARTDAELRKTVGAISARFQASIERTFRELFPAHAAGPVADLAPAFVFALMEGLALERIVGDKHIKSAVILERLKALALLFTPGGRT